MAEAFFNQLAQGQALATSAGTKPTPQVNPTVAQVMLEVGIDISKQYPKQLTLAMLEEADRVVTMGCGEDQSCPATLAPTEDWQLDDPEGQTLEKVREIRDTVKSRVTTLVQELTGGNL